MKHKFTEDELGNMWKLIEEVDDGKMGARHTASIVEVFEQRFANTFNTLAEGGRTPTLWVQYHWMVDVVKIFIKSERLADYDSYLPVLLQQCWTSSQLQDIINMLRMRGYIVS